MSIVNHTKLQKLNFPKRDRKYLLKITIGQCESHLLYILIFDHCHLSGKFRGAAHEVWNLKYKIQKFFLDVFHNLSGYDNHMLIKTLGNSEGDIFLYTN